MSSNRLLPYQFAPGLDASPTRIEQSLLKLAELYDDVPAEFMQRRWSPSHMLWGFSPPSVTMAGNPYLKWYNGSGTLSPILIVASRALPRVLVTHRTKATC